MNLSFEQNQFGASQPTGLSDRLVFDDEPVESLLNPDQVVAPTPASAFEPARQLLNQFGSQTDLISESGFKAFANLIQNGAVLQEALFDTLVMLARSVLPRWPNPPAPEMPPSVGALLVALWDYSRQTRHFEGRITVGSLLWEYFESQHEYERSAAVLQELFALQKQKGNDAVLPTLSNNLAYQYFLNRDWDAAAREFETATRLALQCGEQAGVANSKLNYWLSRIEGNDISSPATVLEEFDSLMAVLCQYQMPMSHRKIFVYTAKLKAMQGDRPAAIESMQRAVELDRQYNTIFLEHDEQLLKEYLQAE